MPVRSYRDISQHAPWLQAVIKHTVRNSRFSIAFEKHCYAYFSYHSHDAAAMRLDLIRKFLFSHRLTLEIMTLQPKCESVETAEGVAITVTGVAQVHTDMMTLGL